MAGEVETKTIYCNATVLVRRDGVRHGIPPGNPVTLPAEEADKLIRQHGGGLYKEPADPEAGKSGKTAKAKDADDGLEEMTVVELRALASEKGYELHGATTKADIIAAIRLGRGE